MAPHLIFLIGYRGAGKTMTARLLADLLRWHWLDADAILEERAGRSIRRIFAEAGEQAFRDLETTILQECCGCQAYVIATGGGVILRPENRERLKHGVTIWLKADADVLWQRLQDDAATSERRPNLAQGGGAEIEDLLRLRTPLYEACQDFTVDTSQRSPRQVAEMIFGWLQSHRGIAMHE
jgi:shikimate kinase